MVIQKTITEIKAKITELDQKYNSSKAYQIGINEAKLRTRREYGAIAVTTIGSIALVYDTINKLL